jgi:hypothetical protein
VRRAFAVAALGTCALVAACNGEFRFDEQPFVFVPDATDGSDVDAALPDASAPPETSTADVPSHTGCTIDADCTLSSLHCDALSGACVACTHDEQCPATRARCDAALHRCVQCGIDGDCKAEERCEPTTRRCVTRCQSLTGCNSSAPFCELDRGFCVRCKTKVECSIISDGHECDDANGMCVECVNDGHCPSEKPRCDRTTGTCAGCLASTDCTASKPLCDPTSRSCVSAE